MQHTTQYMQFTIYSIYYTIYKNIGQSVIHKVWALHIDSAHCKRSVRHITCIIIVENVITCIFEFWDSHPYFACNYHEHLLYEDYHIWGWKIIYLEDNYLCPCSINALMSATSQVAFWLDKVMEGSRGKCVPALIEWGKWNILKCIYDVRICIYSLANYKAYFINDEYSIDISITIMMLKTFNSI